MLQIDDNIVLKPESQVKVFGVTLDINLNFSYRESVICAKVARQLSALAHIPRFLHHYVTYDYLQQFYQQQFYLLFLWKKEWWQNRKKSRASSQDNL